VESATSAPSHMTPQVSCSQKYVSQMSLPALDHSTFKGAWKSPAHCCLLCNRPHVAVSLNVNSRGTLAEEVEEIAEACVELIVDRLEVNAGLEAVAKRVGSTEVSSCNVGRWHDVDASGVVGTPVSRRSSMTSVIFIAGRELSPSDSTDLLSLARSVLSPPASCLCCSLVVHMLSAL
jgi:hypothetical protein